MLNNVYLYFLELINDQNFTTLLLFFWHLTPCVCHRKKRIPCRQFSLWVCMPQRRSYSSDEWKCICILKHTCVLWIHGRQMQLIYLVRRGVGHFIFFCINQNWRYHFQSLYITQCNSKTVTIIKQRFFYSIDACKSLIIVIERYNVKYYGLCKL
jgi:hypothetical protein